MNSDEPATRSTSRRRFLRGAGAAGVVGLLSPTASAIPGSDDEDDAAPIDDRLDPESDSLQEAIVVFESNDAVDRLGELLLPKGYFGFETLPMGYAELTGSQIRRVGQFPEVRYVSADRELEYLNDGTREATNVDAVHEELGYTGEGVEAVLIDSGLDGAHPDFHDTLEHNYEWAGDLLGATTIDAVWVDVGNGDTDDLGHGTHCGGILAGDGSMSDGRYTGMAPDIAFTSYSMNVSATVSIVMALAAYDHMVTREEAGETNVQVCSNSWGAITHDDFEPDAPVNVASWYAFEAGILPVFAYGNSGFDGFNDYAKGGHTFGVAATNHDKTVTGFSSRGRPTEEYDDVNYDRLAALDELEEYYGPAQNDDPIGFHRPSVGTVGADVKSTQAPNDPFWGLGTDAEGAEDLWYARLSGTSMACPGVAGITCLVVEAYRDAHDGDPTPLELMATLGATADEGAVDDYATYDIGAGFVDARAAVEAARADELPGFDDVDLASE